MAKLLPMEKASLLFVLSVASSYQVFMYFVFIFIVIMETFSRIACDDCGKRFSTKRSMSIHKAKSHSATYSITEAKARLSKS